MEQTTDHVNNFIAEYKLGMGDADRLAGAQGANDVEVPRFPRSGAEGVRSAMSMNLQYKKNSEVNDSDMLAGSQVVKNIEVGGPVARKDQGTLS